MLILKTDVDLPISVRNVGHSIGGALKRLEMVFFTEMHLSEDATSKFESHIYAMNSIGKNVLDLGDEETFDLSSLYSRLDFLQQDYSEHALGILTTVSKESEGFEPIASLLTNEINRSFTDEIQMSTVNRLGQLQTLLETTAISTIAGLLRLDWSAVAFIKQFEGLYKRKHEEIINSIRDSITEKLQSGEEFDFETEYAKLTKDAEKQIFEFTRSEVSEHVAEHMRNKYTELFIVNTDLILLRDKAFDVAANCMTYGKAKKILIANLAKELETLHEDLKATVESSHSNVKIDLVEVEEILSSILGRACCKTVKVEEDGDFIRCLVILHSYEADGYYLDFGNSTLEFEISLKDKQVKVVQDTYDIVEATDLCGDLDKYGSDQYVNELIDKIELSFAADKTSVESALKDLVRNT